MKLQEIKTIAKTKGLIFRNMKKENIIRTIQRSEGKNDCFATLKGSECGEEDCIWKADCFIDIQRY